MELGNIGKASYSEFAGKRKLLLIPYVTPTREDSELHQLVESYWADAVAQVRKLEVSLGPIRHLFHEGSIGEGEDAADIIQQGNPLGYPHLRELIDGGAVLEATEDVESLKETLDLHRCLAVVETSESVLKRLVEWFEESRVRRYEAIARTIAEKVEENGVGILVISPDHEVKFADDVEVVYVVPPMLDRVNKWMREHPLTDASAQADGIVGDESAAGPASDEGAPGWANSS